MYDTIMVGIYNYKFVQTHRMYDTKSAPQVNHELRMLRMYHRRLINYNKCITLVGDDDNGEGMHV